MAMDIIPKAIYPVVPFLPGIPPVLRNVAKIADTATFGLLGISDALDSLIGSDSAKWGVFTDGGDPIAIADTILSVEYRNGSRISDYPMEEGAFASYNKVANPYDVRIRMVCGGTEEARESFVAALDDAVESLDLYSVVTPEATWLNANLESWDCRRESKNGISVVIADLYLREIRLTGTESYSAPKTPAAAIPKSQGQVQTFAVPNPVAIIRTIL